MKRAGDYTLYHGLQEAGERERFSLKDRVDGCSRMKRWRLWPSCGMRGSSLETEVGGG